VMVIARLAISAQESCAIFVGTSRESALFIGVALREKREAILLVEEITSA
jgi:hypothetical protein